MKRSVYFILAMILTGALALQVPVFAESVGEANIEAGSNEGAEEILFSDGDDAADFALLGAGEGEGEEGEDDPEPEPEPEPEYYYVIQNANNGTTALYKQDIQVGIPTDLRKNYFSRNGYHFDSWNRLPSGDGERYEDGETVTDIGEANQEVNLYAQWEPNEYKVILDANGGEVDGESESFIMVTYDSTYGEIPRPVRENYNFLGWFNTSGTQVTEETTVKITGTQRLTARWEGVEVQVTFDYNYVDPNTQDVKTETRTVRYDGLYGQTKEEGGMPYPTRPGM